MSRFSFDLVVVIQIIADAALTSSIIYSAILSWSIYLCMFIYKTYTRVAKLSAAADKNSVYIVGQSHRA